MPAQRTKWHEVVTAASVGMSLLVMPVLAKAPGRKRHTRQPITFVCEGGDMAFVAGGYQSMFVGQCDPKSPPEVTQTKSLPDGSRLFILEQSTGASSADAYLALLKPGKSLSAIELPYIFSIELTAAPTSFLIDRAGRFDARGVSHWICRVTVDWDSEKITSAEKVDGIADPDADCDFSNN